MRAEPVCDRARDRSGWVGERIFPDRPVSIDDIHEDERIEVVSYGRPHKVRFASCSSVTFAESHELGLKGRDRKGKLVEVVFD
jgi:hypothetical protein